MSLMSKVTFASKQKSRLKCLGPDIFFLDDHRDYDGPERSNC